MEFPVAKVVRLRMGQSAVEVVTLTVADIVHAVQILPSLLIKEVLSFSSHNHQRVIRVEHDASRAEQPKKKAIGGHETHE